MPARRSASRAGARDPGDGSPLGLAFVIQAHVRHGLRAGLGPEVVDALTERRRVDTDDPRLQLVADLVADALAGGEVDDGAFFRYEQVLGRRGLAEIIALVGYYTAVSLGMRLHGVEPPSADPTN